MSEILRVLEGNKLCKKKITFYLHNLTLVETYFGLCRMTDDLVTNNLTSE